MRNFVLILLVLNLSAYGQKDYEDMSIQELKSVLDAKEGQDKDQILYYLGFKTYKAGESGAANYFRQAEQSSSDDSLKLVIRRRLLKLAIKEGDAESAQKLIKATKKDFASHNDQMIFAQFMQATVNYYLKERDFDKATSQLKAFESYLEEHDHVNLAFQFYYISGNYNYYIGRLDESGESYKKALSLESAEVSPTRMAGLQMNYAIILYRNGKYPTAKRSFIKAIRDFESLEDTLNAAHAWLNLASVYMSTENFDSTVWSSEKALEGYEIRKDSNGIGSAYEYLGHAYKNNGQLDKSLNYHLQALDIRKAAANYQLMAASYSNIATIYSEMRNLDEQYKYIQLALETTKEHGSPYNLARMHGTIAGYYRKEEKWDSAHYYIDKKLSFFKQQGNKLELANSYLAKGNIYKEQGNDKEALDLYVASYDLFVEIGDFSNSAGLAHNIGVIYLERGNPQKALGYVQESFEARQKMDNQKHIMDSHKVLSNIYRDLGSFEEAYRHMRQYSDLKDTIFFSETMNERLAEMQVKFETQQIKDSLAISEQREAAESMRAKNAELARKKADQEAVAKEKQVMLVGIGAIALLIAGGFVLRLARQRKKINNSLTVKNDQISEQNREISLQHDIIQEKNKDILDSITYAKRLQEAILPPEKLVKETLMDSFILFKPKDIVSGDFYWMQALENKALFAVVDCTGHGVPGAMVSMVGHNGLNRAVKEYGKTQPAEILDQLNELVMETFQQGAGNDQESVKDGMDISLATLSFTAENEKESDPHSDSHSVLQWAGANNPLWVVSKQKQLIVNGEQIGANKAADGVYLYEIKGDKQPIGPYDNTQSFRNHQINLNTGDAVYLFSDGYADQFGGAKGKKFKYGQFKRLLLEMDQIPMEEQRKLLFETIDEWKADFEQVDDICVIGVRV